MKNWHQDKLDKLARREKVRKSRHRVGDQEVHERLASEFECSESQWPELISGEGLFAARVVEVHKRYAFISPEPEPGNIHTRDVWLASVARKYTQAARRERNFIAVGDKVLCRPGSQEGSKIEQDLPACVIEHRAPRLGKVARLDPMTPEREHVLATNISQIIIVASYVYPKVKWGLIDRYLVLAEEQEIPAVIVLNKKDLLQEQKPAFQEMCQEYTELYRRLGYPVLSVQAQKPSLKEREDIAALFREQISLVSGHSGVGKSSLVNLMKPEISQEVERDEILTKGRHTTTYASFIKLGKGGYVIDTPGVRSFLIAERDATELQWCFVEMRPYLNRCQFRECQHWEEPGCAVRAAVKNKEISEWRYKSYLAILTGATGREGRLRDIDSTFDEKD